MQLQPWHQLTRPVLADEGPVLVMFKFPISREEATTDRMRIHYNDQSRPFTLESERNENIFWAMG